MNSKVLLFPLKAVLIFLVFSELLIWIGPIDYDINNSGVLSFYLLIVNLAFALGYMLGVKKNSKVARQVPISYIKAFLIIGLFLTLYNLYWLWSRRGIDVSISNLIGALLNPGDAYYSEAETAVRETPFHLFTSPLKFAAIPLGVFTWKRLPKLYRIIVVITCLIEVVTWLGIGTRKGLFDLIIVGLFMVVAANLDFVTVESKYRKLKIITGVSIGVFLLYFAFSGITRTGASGFSDSYLEATRFGIKAAYKDNMPIWLYYPVASIHSYLCQGYYALSKGLEEGFKSLTFMGQSWFTINFSTSHFGYNPLPDTYMQDLIRYDIDPWVNWHTIYLWLANAYSFIGVPFVIMLIGFLFARTWVDVVCGRNTFAVPIFCLFLIMSFYFYANNQVLSFQFLPFMFWLAIWLFFKIKI